MRQRSLASPSLSWVTVLLLTVPALGITKSFGRTEVPGLIEVQVLVFMNEPECMILHGRLSTCPAKVGQTFCGPFGSLPVPSDTFDTSFSCQSELAICCISEVLLLVCKGLEVGLPHC